MPRGASLATLPWPAPAAAAALPQDDDEFPLPDDAEIPLYERPPPDDDFTP